VRAHELDILDTGNQSHGAFWWGIMGNGLGQKVPLTCVYGRRLNVNPVWAIQDLNL